MSIKPIVFSLAAVAVLSQTSTQIYAQDRSSMFLEEVVVTARKREEGLQDAPISISAFSGDSMEYRGMSNISDIAAFTPNLTFQNNPSFSGSSNSAAIYIRGVGQKEFLPTTEPGVGLYVDGVYVARSVGAILDLIDVERVEVLRGPQGTLFGRNTIGGAISLTTRKPHEEFGGKISLTAGDDSRADLKASLNMPLSETLFSSISVASFNRDGYVTREDGVDLGDDDTKTARLALRWIASDRVNVDFSVDTTKDRENGPAFSLAAINFGDPVDPDTPPMATIHNVGANLAAGGIEAPCAFPGMELNLAVPGCYDSRYIQGDEFNAGTAPAYSNSDLFSSNLSVSWDINEQLQLRSITAIRDLDSEFARDGDHSPFVIAQFFDNLQQEQFTQEFQLLGSTERLEWILGAYYFEEDGNNINLLDFTVSSFRSGGLFANEATAFYGQLTYDLTDKFSLSLGMRYTDETKSFTPDQVILNNPFAGSGHPLLDAPFMQVGQRILPFLKKEISISEATPMLNFSYQANEQTLWYATYSEGFKSGGFSQRVFPPIVAPFTAPAGTPEIDLIPTFEPEFAEGFKYATADNSFTLNGAIFQTDYKDLQVQVFTSVAPVTANAASASISGFELETQWVAGSGWVLNAGLGYVDASYDDLDEALTLFPASNAFERVPEWTASTAISKEFGFETGAAVIARIDIAYQDDTFNDSFNTAAIAQEAYSIVNANIAWLSADDAHRVTLGATNLTDEDYLQTGVAGDAFQALEVVHARSTEWYLSYAYEF